MKRVHKREITCSKSECHKQCVDKKKDCLSKTKKFDKKLKKCLAAKLNLNYLVVKVDWISSKNKRVHSKQKIEANCEKEEDSWGKKMRRSRIITQRKYRNYIKNNSEQVSARNINKQQLR